MNIPEYPLESIKKRNTRGYLRRARRNTINRKKYIIKHIKDFRVKYDGQLAKGKVHCGCYLCKGFDYKKRKFSDMERIKSMEKEISEYIGSLRILSQPEPGQLED